MAAGSVPVLVAVSKTPQWGWISPRALGLVAAGAILIVAWIRLELRAREPLVDMRMMRTVPSGRRTWRHSCSASACTR